MKAHRFPIVVAELYSMAFLIYSCLMSRRTTLEVDDTLLTQAQLALGTRGLKETVDTAFREAIRRYLRERLAERIQSGAGIDRSPELLAASRPLR